MSRPDPFAPIGAPGATRSAKPKAAWQIVVPVPPGAPSPPVEHFKLGKPSGQWTYTDASGGTIGYVLRFDTGDGEKEFRPLTLWRPKAGGSEKWRWESWPAPRPLYGLRRLAERPSAPVVVTEGEKAADAAARLLPGFVVVSSLNGSKGAGAADWTPLRGRQVTIWPDADVPGLEYARAVAERAAAVGVKAVAIVSLPEGVDVGWDAADALAEGWDETRAAKLIAAGVLADARPMRGRKREQQRSDFITAVLATGGVELWRDSSAGTYATVPVNDHLENWPLQSVGFERWLYGLCYQKNGTVLKSHEIDEIRRILEIKAYSEGRTYEPCVRVASAKGMLYLDLCDARWRVVEITASHWHIVEQSPVKFLRSPSARPLPEPVAGDVIERLCGFINVANEDDFKLIVSWLVMTLQTERPFPILIVNGAHGTGKSLLCRLLRLLIDPDIALICSPPANERDLVLAAANTWVSAFDNLSLVAGFLPDALCRLASGGGFRTRALHTNREEAVFWVQRPVLLNGIPTLTDAADLADRAIVINLASISPEQRRPEIDFWQEFESVRGRILGSLLDAAVRALSNIDEVQLRQPGRMADFEKWSIAAAPALGWTGEEFQSAYRKNKTVVADDAFEADLLALSVRDHLTPKYPNRWEGAPAALQIELDALTPEGLRKSRSWPKTPAQMGNSIRRAKPLLENKGYTVEFRRSGTRSIIIVPPVKEDRA